MTNQTMRKQFVKLLNIHGVSGEEKNVRNYLMPCLKHSMDKVMVDDYGNLLGEKVYGTGEGAIVMLSAHMDTVRSVYADRKIIERDGFFMSDYGTLGADDRAGIAIVLEVLRTLNKQTSFNGTLKIAFSREEEIGCVGASQIDTAWYEDVDLAIVVDRRGTRDIVVGCYEAFCSNEVGIFMENVAKMIDQDDWACVEGGVSDAMTFSSNGTNSINLSAGYDNEHSSSEYASLKAMKDTAKLILQAFAIIDTFAHLFGHVEKYNHWVKPLYKEDNYNWDRDGNDYNEYSVSKYLTADYTTPDGDLEMYYLSNDEFVLKQDSQEIYFTTENLDYIMNQLKGNIKGVDS